MRTTSLTALQLLTALPLCAQSTIDPALQFSWAANAGFINWRPAQPGGGDGARVHEHFLSGKIYAANFGWIDLGDGTPANGLQYQNNSATDFGVNVLPAGGLEGYGWSANTGWINFEQIHGQPRLDYLSGYLLGYAWSPNIGWITLGEFAPRLRTLNILCTDTDADGIGDEYERTHFGNLATATALTDFDKDGRTDRDEYTANTDPKDRTHYLRFLDFQPQLNGGVLYGGFLASPRRLYQFEWSGNLTTWSSIPNWPLLLPTNFPESEIGFPAAADSRRYYRLRAVRPLAP